MDLPAYTNRTQYNEEKERVALIDPLFWSLMIQCSFSLIVFAMALHLWLRTMLATNDTIKYINFEIQLVEHRLLIQDPNVHLMGKIAKEINLAYDDLGGYSTNGFQHMWDNVSDPTSLSGAKAIKKP